MRKHPKILSCIATAIVAFGSTAIAAEKITWDQVLKDPGNLTLNLAFAQQRIADGNLLSAAATLERLLFSQPNWDEARLLYAGVLYRLGDFAAADHELDMLEGRDLSDEEMAQLQAYRNRVANAQQKTRVFGRLSGGIGYDENAATLITEDTGGGLLRESIEQYSFVGRGKATIERDISDTANRTVFAQGEFYTKQFEDSDLGGFSILTARAGMRQSGSVLDTQLNVTARLVSIGGDTYLTEVGGEARVSRDIGAKSKIGATVGIFEQEYESILGDGDSTSGRSGTRYDLSVRASHAPNARVKVSGRIDYRDKTADINDFAYTFIGGQVGLDVFLPRNAYIDTDIIFRDYDYDGTFGVAVGAREDQYSYARIAAGAPLSTLMGKQSFANGLPLIAEISVNRTERESNAELFEFESTGAELRFIWNFQR